MFRSPEQAEFNQFVANHISNPDAPLLIEGATGLGKTRAYLAAVFQTDKRVAICLATNALIEQILNSSDLPWAQELAPDKTVAVFRSRRYFEDDREAYEAQREAAQIADILICTASSVIFDQRLSGSYNGVTNRDVIVFDEADQIPGLAALASDLSIDRKTLRDLNCAASTALEVAGKLLSLPQLDSEIRAKAKIIAEIASEPEVWYKRVGMTEEGGVSVIHRLPGRLLKKISNRPSTIFISATLSINGQFNDFKRAMGIGDSSSLSRIIEPKHHGHLSFSFFTDDPVDSDEWLATVVEQIEASDTPVLVATPSHKLATELGDRISGSTVRQRDETMTDAVGRMGDRDIVIGAGAWAGMDTPVQWATVIIPRVPFTGPNELFDTWTDEDAFRIGDPMTSYFDSKNAATRRLKQVFGRGLRHPDARCAIVICDPRISQLGDVAPVRFREGWFEGRRVEVVQSKAERNPALRRDALRHHGTDCQTCGHQPLILREVEVHHLNPIAEAKGMIATSMDDVAVLCRICHARAHKDGNNVIPLERLREIAKAKSRTEAQQLISF
ncbi:hypothetical protein C1J05_04080 [Sulfitobacter sp. JL08]|uniref:DEAD/DEAH box helicase n=1 Tax=Sulfitobacter sp. JL08 TaxID=2070369 RepID=UPI000E0B17F6|nr:DEAD/DEAH box helicase [Sulfitobacter sp. JL08]AXI53787.1 hypothetical protein C1J05_04080 [Sulfitobacter sp. JL08]